MSSVIRRSRLLTTSTGSMYSASDILCRSRTLDGASMLGRRVEARSRVLAGVVTVSSARARDVHGGTACSEDGIEPGALGSTVGEVGIGQPPIAAISLACCRRDYMSTMSRYVVPPDVDIPCGGLRLSCRMHLGFGVRQSVI